jgi:1-deoxy-D-xylulose-5-phosphate reductoisomerase
VAVAGFLGGKLGFTEIPMVIERTLEEEAGGAARTLEELYAADARARRSADRILQMGARTEC